MCDRKREFGERGGWSEENHRCVSEFARWRYPCKLYIPDMEASRILGREAVQNGNGCRKNLHCQREYHSLFTIPTIAANINQSSHPSTLFIIVLA
jgi:hypothetical protein